MKMNKNEIKKIVEKWLIKKIKKKKPIKTYLRRNYELF